MQGKIQSTQIVFQELEKIRKALHSDYQSVDYELVEVNTDHNGRSFEMHIPLIGYVGLDYLLYQFDTDDAAHTLFPFFSKDEHCGLNRMCDYIAFVETENTLFIVCFELKKSSTSSMVKKAKLQLEAGKCFVDFIEASLNRTNQAIDKNIEYRYVLVTEPKKGRTKISKHTYDSDRFIALTLDSIRLNQLIKYEIVD